MFRSFRNLSFHLRRALCEWRNEEETFASIRKIIVIDSPMDHGQLFDLAPVAKLSWILLCKSGDGDFDEIDFNACAMDPAEDLVFRKAGERVEVSRPPHSLVLHLCLTFAYMATLFSKTSERVEGDWQLTTRSGEFRAGPVPLRLEITEGEISKEALQTHLREVQKTLAGEEVNAGDAKPDSEADEEFSVSPRIHAIPNQVVCPARLTVRIQPIA